MKLLNIIDKPNLTPEEIWLLDEKNFYAWRKKYDLPRIINHFNEKLNNFNEWKNEFSIDDEFLIEHGISNCIKPNFHKDKRKYLVEKEWNKEITKEITFQNIDKKYYRLGPHNVIYKVLKTFVGYIDWCIQKKIKIHPQLPNYDIMGWTSKSSYDTPQIIIKILDGLELLKVGGIKITPSLWTGQRIKYFEFVNASYLAFEGKFTSYDKQLVFDYSFVDNLTCINSHLHNISFIDCSLINTEINNSYISRWSITRCFSTGYFNNTDFISSRIYGGNFLNNFNSTRLSGTYVNHSSNKDYSFEHAYRKFKQIYASQGNDSIAVKYFLLEKKFLRLKTKKEIFKPIYPKSIFTEKKIIKFIKSLFYGFINFFKYLNLLLNNLYWGYGRKPIWIIFHSLIIIVGFALIYQYGFQCFAIINKLNFVDSLYYSTSTFLTFGISNYDISGELKLVVLSEALLGALNLGFLIAGFSNNNKF